MKKQCGILRRMVALWQQRKLVQELINFADEQQTNLNLLRWLP